MLSSNLEQTLHRALAVANERRHEYATLEHLLLALTEDSDAIAVLRACGIDLEQLRGTIGDYIDNESGPTGLLHPFWCDGRSGSQDVYTDSVNLQLFTNVDTVSAATGGTVGFQIRVGPNHAGESYLMVASGSGTSPGATIAGGVHVPLNPDFWTTLSISFANSAIFPGSAGVLDAKGASTAQMNTLGPFDPLFIGTDLDFSVVTIGGGGIATHATPPTRVSLVP